MNGHEGAKASPTLVPLTTNEELLSWAEKIKPHVPQCAMMYNSLLLHGGSHVSHGRFYILQDQLTSHVVVYEGTFQLRLQHIGLFCLEEEVDQLTEALRSAPFVDWGGDLILYCIPPYLLDHMQQLMEKRTKVTLFSSVGFIYNPHQDTQPLRVGPGLRMCRLGKEGIYHLFKTSEFSRILQLEVLSSLAQKTLYVGVYRDSAVTQDTIVDPNSLPMAGDEEVPVALGGTSIVSAAVGKLWTDEGYRRQGLGSLVINTVARQQANLYKMIPHAFVLSHNTASRAMFTKLSGWKLTHDFFSMTNLI